MMAAEANVSPIFYLTHSQKGVQKADGPMKANLRKARRTVATDAPTAMKFLGMKTTGMKIAVDVVTRRKGRGLAQEIVVTTTETKERTDTVTITKMTTGEATANKSGERATFKKME